MFGSKIQQHLAAILLSRRNPWMVVGLDRRVADLSMVIYLFAEKSMCGGRREELWCTSPVRNLSHLTLESGRNQHIQLSEVANDAHDFSY
jgi:hypothetical protein